MASLMFKQPGVPGANRTAAIAGGFALVVAGIVLLTLVVAGSALLALRFGFHDIS